MKNNFEIKIANRIIKNKSDLSILNLNKREIKQVKNQLLKYLTIFNDKSKSEILLHEDFMF